MPTSTFSAIGVRKVDFTEHKSYSSYFVLLPTELYDYRQVRVPMYLGKSVRELSVGTKQAPVSCLCSMLCGMRSGFVVFVPKILSRMANPRSIPSEDNPEPKSTPVSYETSIGAHFDFFSDGGT